MAEGGLLGGALTDEGGGIGGGAGVGAVLLGLVLYHFAGLGVDLVVVFGALHVEFHLIDHASIVVVVLGLHKGGVGGGDSGVLQSGLLGGLQADVGALAGRAGGGNGSGVCRAAVLLIAGSLSF